MPDGDSEATIEFLSSFISFHSKNGSVWRMGIIVFLQAFKFLNYSFILDCCGMETPAHDLTVQWARFGINILREKSRAHSRTIWNWLFLVHSIYVHKNGKGIKDLSNAVQDIKLLLRSYDTFGMIFRVLSGHLSSCNPIMFSNHYEEIQLQLDRSTIVVTQPSTAYYQSNRLKYFLIS